MKRVLKQSTLMSLIHTVTIGLVGIMIVLFLAVMALNHQVLRANENQASLNTYAQQFITASNTLTENVRAFAASSNTLYYDAYYQETVLDKNCENSIAAMQELGITETENTLLEEMSNLSQELAPLQKEAMDFVNQRQNKNALDIVYGSQYNKTLNEIFVKQESFLTELHTRTQNEMDALQQKMILIQIASICMAAIVVISQLLGIWITHRRIIQPIQMIQQEMMELSKGNLSMHSQLQADTSELGMLVFAMQNTRDSLRAYISDIREKLTEIAKGNIQQVVELDYVGDFSEIKISLQTIITSLNHTLYRIDQSAEHVNTHALQVADGAQALAQGSTEQAASVQQLAATVKEVSCQIQQSTDNIKEAMQEIHHSQQEVSQCTTKMSTMTDAMDEIRNTSQQISHIIQTIEDIAFQTNLLALNAAVEAARAGLAGRGFAVVADEVRNLANKSAEASKQTAQLIETAKQAVDQGVRIATETASALTEVVQSIEKSNTLMEQISNDAYTQNEAVSQINIGIDQISTVVQNNSSTAEQSASASLVMEKQAHLLKELVEQFHFSKQKNALPPKAINIREIVQDTPENIMIEDGNSISEEDIVTISGLSEMAEMPEMLEMADLPVSIDTGLFSSEETQAPSQIHQTLIESSLALAGDTKY